MTHNSDENQFIRRIIDPEQTGKRIRALRERRGITVIRMSDMIGVTAAAVYRWEKGNTLPDLGNVPSLCDVLGEPFEGIFICEPKKPTEI